ncbi:MAG: hypothetical protein ACYST6_11910 [Planctomycetota bacterium]|jgi:hypothetical protein
MDNNELILTGAVSPPMVLELLGGASSCKPLQDLDKNAAGELSQAKKKQVAKDFESVFISKLLDEMKNTIGDWGFERDGASQQISRFMEYSGCTWPVTSRTRAVLACGRMYTAS